MRNGLYPQMVDQVMYITMGFEVNSCFVFLASTIYCIMTVLIHILVHMWQ